MFIFVGASLAVIGCGVWWLWLWRRRRLSAAVAAAAPVYWEDERTLYSTYEDLGIIQPGGSPPQPAADATTSLDMELMGMDAAELVTLDARTTSIDMSEFMDVAAAPSSTRASER
ncbi:hypothetical protein ENSA7_49560 [Enhygromyxa salina]|uniref:Uncharacterized protein n=2 Tax=Enhygromyxa salina TaxID=215803 RepID=A0A2S9YI43_9BACT|nr:hypothetical protein ENSA7_49560 [Enhygromyxa salina]